MTDENRFSSPTIGALAAALAKAQAVMEDAVKGKFAQAFKGAGYAYADLATTLAAIRPALSANGLSLVQTTEPDGQGGSVLRTALIHASGEWLAGEMPLRPAQNTPQGMGSAITYARRYAAMAICGIAAEDDDGAEASQPSHHAAENAFRGGPSNHDRLPQQHARGRGRPARTATPPAQVGQALQDSLDAHDIAVSPEYREVYRMLTMSETTEQLAAGAGAANKLVDEAELDNARKLYQREKRRIEGRDETGSRNRAALRQRIEGDKPA